MMMGRSPIIMDNNAKRILSTTPSRRASNHVERVGSPSLSGYPVRIIIQCHLEAKDWKILGCLPKPLDCAIQKISRKIPKDLLLDSSF